MTKVHPVAALTDNYIWIVHDDTHAVAVDPGEEKPILTWLQARRLNLSAILVTHHHGDHVGAVMALANRYACPVYGPVHPRIPALTHPVSEGMQVRLASPHLDLRVMALPGHTREHVAYHGAGRIFCGDTLFSCGCGRIFDGTPEQLYQSLQRLAALPEDSLVYCAHEYTLANIRFALSVDPGNAHLQTWAAEAQRLRAQGLPTLPTRLGDERRMNPFLRCEQPEIREAIFPGSPITEDTLAVFTKLRAQKDVYKASV
jgi:hydroxyacylglutathione hydrolase